MMMPPGVLLPGPVREQAELRAFSKTEYGERRCAWITCELMRRRDLPQSMETRSEGKFSFLKMTARRRLVAEETARMEPECVSCCACGQMTTIAASGMSAPLRRGTYRRP